LGEGGGGRGFPGLRRVSIGTTPSGACRLQRQPRHVCLESALSASASLLRCEDAGGIYFIEEPIEECLSSWCGVLSWISSGMQSVCSQARA
jgi:hypothetical protein